MPATRCRLRDHLLERRNLALTLSCVRGPTGRNCSHAERDEFERYDLANGVRSTMVAVLQVRQRGAGWRVRGGRLRAGVRTCCARVS